MKIIIIGSGWYGSHISLKLSKEHEILIIEKNDRIFCGASYYNQNRLHLGYHYPRNFDTRNSCKDYFNDFNEKYNFLVENIDKNYYIISKDSFIDYQTYKNIYDYEKYKYKLIDINDNLNHIDGNIFCVEEKFINSEKAREYFENEFKNKKIKVNLCEIFLNYKKSNNKIEVFTDKNIYICDMLIDCTYNHSQLSKKMYNYEITLSLVYEKILDCDFDSLTIMDGKFGSLYKRDIDKNLYTLTDVEYTPIISSTDFSLIKEYKISNEIFEERRKKMVEKIKKYFHKFDAHFVYNGYFISHKTKLESNSDFRDLIFEEIEQNVLTVNCGKIYGIFKFEKLVIDYISRQK